MALIAKVNDATGAVHDRAYIVISNIHWRKPNDATCFVKVYVNKEAADNGKLPLREHHIHFNPDPAGPPSHEQCYAYLKTLTVTQEEFDKRTLPDNPLPQFKDSKKTSQWAMSAIIIEGEVKDV